MNRPTVISSRAPKLLLAVALIFAGLQGCSSKPAPDPQSPSAADGFNDDDLTAGWPDLFDTDQGRIMIYQPQPESLDGNQLKARAAVSLTPVGSASEFGVASFTARINTDRDTRMVWLDRITVSSVRLAGATADAQQQFANNVAGQLTAMTVRYPLDQFMASLETCQRKQHIASELGDTPPWIIFSSKPAVLITVAGPPQLKPVEGHPGVARVINTPFVLLQDDGDHRFFLKEGTRWAGASAFNGPWQQNPLVPPAIDAAGKTLTTSPTGQPAAGTQPADLAAPPADADVIVSTVPAELIVTTGDPQFTPVPGGHLLYASNTASNLFLDSTSNQYFVLLAGRWYAAMNLQGPWHYTAADKLPADFAKIPSDSPKASVLAFVAGTPEAADALLEAEIPQTAAIRRDAGASLNVSYDGAPQFQPIPQCPGLSYAVNTPDEVVQLGMVFYCCHQAVWYQSGTASGPWTVSTSVPDIIYTIPPQNPLYNVTFVHVYGSTDDDVDDGYTPGYTGTYVSGPTIVYGTGYDYQAWLGEAYFPEPATYGFNPYYDADTGYWGFDDGFYGGVGGWFATNWGDRGWWDHHRSGRWGTHRWWGQGGYLNRHDIRGRMADAGRYGTSHRGGEAGELAARIPGSADRGPGWHNLYARPGNASRNVDLSATRLHEPTYARGEEDNVYAGHDGQVYRRITTGWERRAVGSESTRNWAAIDRAPEARAMNVGHGPVYEGGGASGLDRDFAARSRGFSRASSFHRSGGGFHGGGGGFHGGGGGHGGGRR